MHSIFIEPQGQKTLLPLHYPRYENADRVKTWSGWFSAFKTQIDEWLQQVYGVRGS